MLKKAAFPCHLEATVLCGRIYGHVAPHLHGFEGFSVDASNTIIMTKYYKRNCSIDSGNAPHPARLFERPGPIACATASG
jgi:hypothetical protein